MTDAPDLPALQGIWRRKWLRSQGIEDAETEVIWFQADDLHVDLRLPPGHSDIAGPLESLTPAACRRLAAAEGFAGRTKVKAGLCTWVRQVNWKGPIDGPDAGRMTWRGDALHEAGVFAEYEELWQRLGPSGAAPSTPAAARRLTDRAGRIAVLIRIGDRFALGRGAPEAMTGPPLSERLETALAARHRAALERLFDMEFCCGSMGLEGGRIERSSLPGRVGDLAFEGDPFAPEASDGIVLLTRGFDGAARATPWRPAP